MYSRIEVAMRPEFADPTAKAWLRKVELALPEVRKKIRWARVLNVYWLDLPLGREEIMGAVGEIFWDRVLQYLFTGNLLPSASGKTGTLADLMSEAPARPGKFWAIERRFRPGVTDNVGRTTLEAFEIVLGRKLPEGRAAGGAMVLLEGPQVTEEDIEKIASQLWVNELIETWTLYPESELNRSDRFHPDRIRHELPKVELRAQAQAETIRLPEDPAALEELSVRNLWALSRAEMVAIRDHYKALGKDPTDVEIEIFAQTWSEHCKHKIFGAHISYVEDDAAKAQLEAPSAKGLGIPARVESLFKKTIAGTTKELPRPWLLSVFDDNAGIVAFDDDHAFCIKVETHNSPSALDPYGGALTGIVGVNRDILGCGLGAKPIANTDVFCVAPIDREGELPERILHPRRILAGVRQGVEAGGNQSGIPTVNGALYFDERFLGKPLVYCGTLGWMPRMAAGRPIELKELKVGDRVCMVGGRIGKDGIHGATFSSLAMDEFSPSSAVQLGDPITQKRTADFLLEARDLGLYRAITDNGAGGLSSSVGELARLTGGARIDVSKARTKYPGLKPFELVVSESQERMTVAVIPERMKDFLALAERRSVEVSDLGEFTASGKFEIYFGESLVGSLDLEFLHGGAPKLEIKARWSGRPRSEAPGPDASRDRFMTEGAQTLTRLLGRPNIASKEWLIRQYDHEVQGMSVVKPLHQTGVGTAASRSGPNDAGVLKPKVSSNAGIAIGCGLNPRLSDIDPALMAQAAVDEAVRNVLAAGAAWGKSDSVVALVDNFCWPDPLSDEGKAAALVRACYGLRRAALELQAPLVSGKDSMKNDYKGKIGGKSVQISVPPTLLMTAVAQVPDIAACRTSDFKDVGDLIAVLGPAQLGLRGSEFAQVWAAHGGKPFGRWRTGEPDWEAAKATYSWIGGARGTQGRRLKSAHDVSEGGVLVAVAEGLIARGFGAEIEAEPDWELAFGEGFHTFVVSYAAADAAGLEAEWRDLGVPFQRIGQVTKDAFLTWGTMRATTESLHRAWSKEGYWE